MGNTSIASQISKSSYRGVDGEVSVGSLAVRSTLFDGLVPNTPVSCREGRGSFGPLQIWARSERRGFGKHVQINS